MVPPSTPRQYTEPFSSPARGVGWTPGASSTLLDELSRDAREPCTSVERVLDSSVSPVRRTARPLFSVPTQSHGPFSGRSASFQPGRSPISDDMTRFLASPINSSPPQTTKNRSSSPSAERTILFYGASLNPNDPDRYYQFASPAPMPSRSASFNSSPPTMDCPSFPMVPPSTTSPSFNLQSLPGAHVSSGDVHSGPASLLSMTSPGATLPPSSPPYEPSSSSVEDDPFTVRRAQGALATTGLLTLPGNTSSGNEYQLPNTESCAVPRVTRRTRRLQAIQVYSSHAGSIEMPQSLARTHTPSSSTCTPALTKHNGLSQDVCAPSTSRLDFVTPAIITSGAITSSQFTFPTPATTVSLATPSTSTSLLTPAPSTLLHPVDIVDPRSLSKSSAAWSKKNDYRRQFMRSTTPSPVPFPESVKELVPLDVRGSRKRKSCIFAETDPEQAEQVGLSELLPSNTDSTPGTGGRSRFQPDRDSTRSKRARVGVTEEERVGRNTKRPKRKAGALLNPEIEADKFMLDFKLARPTRSQTRAMAALLASDSTATKAETSETNEICTSSDEPSPSTHHVAKRTRGQLGALAKERVIGRAPSRVDVNFIEDEIEMSGSTNEESEDGEYREEVHHDEDSAIEQEESAGATRQISKRIIPSELLPRPGKATIFNSNGGIRQRVFPLGFPINSKYAKWYRRFPVSAYFQENDPAKSFVLGSDAPKSSNMQPREGGSALVPNSAEHFNLYTPRFVRGVSHSKHALCPICVEPVWRGGEGKNVMLNTKISAYNYHMQYYHGVSSRSGLPFSPPTGFRRKSRPAAGERERAIVEEGKCHSCERWIQLQGSKDVDTIVPELFWWKHAASCHGKSRAEGDTCPYLEDNVYLRLREYQPKDNIKIETQDNSGGFAASALVELEDVAEGTITAETPSPGEGRSPDNIRPTAGHRLTLQGAECLTNNLRLMDSDSDLTDLEDDDECMAMDL